MVCGMINTPVIVYTHTHTHTHVFVDCIIKDVCMCTEYIPAVGSMSILFLWHIQLTFDQDEIEP